MRRHVTFAADSRWAGWVMSVIGPPEASVDTLMISAVAVWAEHAQRPRPWHAQWYTTRGDAPYATVAAVLDGGIPQAEAALHWLAGYRQAVQATLPAAVPRCVRHGERMQPAALGQQQVDARLVVVCPQPLCGQLRLVGDGCRGE